MKVALIGNPNCGKTSLFNILTGSNQKVGNWPGVTIDKKEGQLQSDKTIELIDLPGVYSLNATSPEEVIARDYLLQESPDVLINIVDGTNLERNLYLTLQLLDLNIPIVVAINMSDLMQAQKIKLDLNRLAYQIDTEVILISATRKIGLERLVKEIKAIATKEVNLPRLTYSSQLETMIAEADEVLLANNQNKRFEIISYLEDQKLVKNLKESELIQLNEIRRIGEQVLQNDLLNEIITERYQKIKQIMQFSLYTKNSKQKLSRLIDQIVTNKYLAFPIFILVMWLVYFLSIQTVGTFLTDWVNDNLFGSYLPEVLTKMMQHYHIVSWLQDLIINGIVAGVGAVLGFLPQIAVLFLCLNILDDCGYMARIAFVMDRIFRFLGLSGKSFIPLLISTGCGVPGIMASRTIENEDERKMTIMLTTFMPCSAKTAIIALIVGAFFQNNSWIAPAVYFISLFTIIISGLLLKNSPFFHRDDNVFVMELPDYHFPHWTNVLKQTWQRCKAFIQKAATIIFISSIVLWFLSNFSWQLRLVAEDQSILASLGKIFAWLFYPLGFGNWRATVAVMTAFSAKENIINTLGILYHQTINSVNGVEIWQMLRRDYTVYAAFSFLIFNVLCTPCFAAIGAMKREFGSIKMTVMTIIFQCSMAYIVSFLIYQFSLVLLAGKGMTITTYIALIILGMLIFGMMYKFKQKDVKVNG